MNNSRRILFATALAAASIGTGAVYVSAQNDTHTASGNLFPYSDDTVVAQGQQIYGEHCAACHGADLEGQENWQSRGPDGRALAPPHDETGHTWHHPDAQLFQIVKFGTAALVGNGYQSDMSGYEDVFGDDDIRAVMAFIKSTWPVEIIRRHDAMNAEVASR